jgi:hypothetical protein
MGGGYLIGDCAHLVYLREMIERHFRVYWTLMNRQLQVEAVGAMPAGFFP